MLQQVRLAGIRACAWAAVAVMDCSDLHEEAAGQLVHVGPSSLSMLLASPATPQQVSC